MIHSYYLEITEPEFTWQQQLLPLVPEDRRKNVLRYRFAADRLLALYAALLTRMVLSREIGVAADELVIRQDQNGKPYLADFEGFHFNLSHTRCCILFCYSNQKPVGADVEKIQVPPLEIMKTVFHQDEITYIEEAAALDKSLRFYEMWTRKEACLKKAGTGFHSDPRLCNTLLLPDIFYTYRVSDYLCTVCCDSIDAVSKNRVTEAEIAGFYGFSFLV